ncbi:MAG: hypothetical protein HZB82_06650 [Deltaproteobacteria bacterium]|nr:hypothetical protein [Deltaproteobacteria bacterium]
MKKQSIKSHLKPYSIFQKRKTTINHAFASALAPTDDYNEQHVNNAINSLYQNPDSDLICVYCDNTAETWDHLVGLVKEGNLRGYGHQIGNLVPCCKECNSKKGSKDWQEFIDSEKQDEEKRSRLKRCLQTYIEHFAKPVDINTINTEMPNEYMEYLGIREQIFSLMKRADTLVEIIRNNKK